jgi:hypothetical protein
LRYFLLLVPPLEDFDKVQPMDIEDNLRGVFRGHFPGIVYTAACIRQT